MPSLTSPENPPQAPRSRLGSLSLATRLQVVDRWPTLISHPILWDRLRCIEAFHYRWNEVEPPAETARWYARLEALEDLPLLSGAFRQRHRALARRVVDRGLRPSDVNLGSGGRRANSLMVAAAVDAHFDGAPASALGWGESRDPVRVLDVRAGLGLSGPAETATSAVEVRRVVESWGPGGKGVLSLRDPDSVFLWVINAVNRNGEAEFFDYSMAVRATPTGAIRSNFDPRKRAEELIEKVDPRSSFASVQLWRTKNLSGESRLADDLFEVGVGSAAVDAVSEAVAMDAVSDSAAMDAVGGSAAVDAVSDSAAMDAAIEAALPPGMPSSTRKAATTRIRFFGEHRAALWLVESVWRGALTFLPTDLTSIASGEASGEEIEALTRVDSVVLTLARRGRLRMMGPHIEIVVADTPDNRRLAESLVGAKIRDAELDGIAEGCLEVWLDPWAQQRLHEDRPVYAAPIVDDAVIALSETEEPVVRWRSLSWFDVNRVTSAGQRRTNCWNCASAVAHWVSERTISTALPIYDEASYRPTIPDYLESMGVVGEPTYVNTQAEAEQVARSWGPNTQGLVVCSLTRDSTHIFNVVFDGLQVRFLDGHMGRDGDYNFDSDWMRIGVVGLDRPARRSLVHLPGDGPAKATQALVTGTPSLH